MKNAFHTISFVRPLKLSLTRRQPSRTSGSKLLSASIAPGPITFTNGPRHGNSPHVALLAFLRGHMHTTNFRRFCLDFAGRRTLRFPALAKCRLA